MENAAWNFGRMIAVFGLACGCATAHPVNVETVGVLTPSETNVYTQPVHATTDLPSSFGVVDTDAGTVGAIPAEETMDVIVKAPLVMGSAR